MAAEITYLRRTDDGLLTTSNITRLFPDWQGEAERWMFVSPHDDDMVIGAGLTFQAGLAEGARFSRGRHRRTNGLLPVRAASQHHQDSPRGSGEVLSASLVCRPTICGSSSAPTAI